tara:strand:- start:210 stop:530 length:321 start_codon:yes stop_codon:yes gene_type:complete
VQVIKIIFTVSLFILLNGCLQSTAMVGPATTFIYTGNIYHAGVNYSANKAVEKETGMTTTELITNQMTNSKKTNNQDNQIQKELENSLRVLLELNIQKTHEIISKE